MRETCQFRARENSSRKEKRTVVPSQYLVLPLRVGVIGSPSAIVFVALLLPELEPPLRYWAPRKLPSPDSWPLLRRRKSAGRTRPRLFRTEAELKREPALKAWTVGETSPA